VFGDFLPGEPDAAVTRELEVGIAGRIALAVASSAVKREAVKLHDQLITHPARVAARVLRESR
jgi:hypothetical protein